MLARLLLFVVFLLHGHALAQSPIRLDPAQGSVTLDKQLSWLEDTSAAMTIDQVLASPDWRPLGREPGFGFTRAAIWLRFTVEQPSTQAPWRLELRNALLEDVRLFVSTPAGGWREQRAGQALPHTQWPFDTRSPVFALEPEPGSHEVLLRLATPTSLSTGIRLWTTERYQAYAIREAMTWGAYFGLYGMVILFQVMFWRWTREALSGWYVPYSFVIFMSLFLTLGYPQKVLGWTAELATPMLGVLLCSGIAITCKFASVQLELAQTMPRLNRWLVAAGTSLSVVTSLLVLAGHYGAGVATAQVLLIVLIALLFYIAVVLWRRGHTPAVIFLAAASIFYIGVVIRFLRNLGALAPTPLTDNSVQVGSLLHMIAMCLFIVYRYNTLKIALQTEQAARQEQRSFVAMVSHEYRTPLAVIGTSVQQLAANLDAPQERTLRRCANIKRAADRMTELLDHYLSAERLEETAQPLCLARCDPRELIEGVVREWDAAQVALTLDALPPIIVCDRSLLAVALRNLLANALRHSPPDGIVEVAGRGDGKHGLTLSVGNRGDDIPADEMPRLFQKYFRGRASRNQPGAGLGLFLVKRIADQHGGRVSVYSKGGRTVFTLSLPGIGGDAPSRG